MAYFLGPMLGGEVSQYIGRILNVSSFANLNCSSAVHFVHTGFSWLMYTIGTANILYACFLYFFVLGVFLVKVSYFRNAVKSKTK